MASSRREEPAPVRVRQRGRVAVTREQRRMAEVLHREDIVQPVAAGVSGPGPFATVEVSGSITRNMGDFNSIRIHVSLSVPCLPDVRHLDATYLNVSRWVDSKLQREEAIASGVTDENLPDYTTEEWEYPEV